MPSTTRTIILRLRQHADAGQPITLRIEWRKNRTWGLCPAALWVGQRIAYASGCGYDKLSAVLDDVLHFLAPNAKHTAGAGPSATMEAAKAAGWDLQRDYCGTREESWTFRPAPTSTPAPQPTNNQGSLP